MRLRRLDLRLLRYFDDDVLCLNELMRSEKPRGELYLRLSILVILIKGGCIMISINPIKIENLRKIRLLYLLSLRITLSCLLRLARAISVI